MLPIHLPELSEYQFAILTFSDFLNQSSQNLTSVKAVFHILDKKSFNKKKNFDENLKKTRKYIVLNIPIGVLSSIKSGSIFEFGKLISNTTNWFSKHTCSDCNINKAERTNLGEYFIKEFKKEYFRSLPDEFKLSNATILKKYIGDENEGITMDIVIPDSVAFLRFGGISSYSIENILLSGLPNDHTNPIYYDADPDNKENNIIIFLKKSVPDIQAKYWATCIYYPNVREELNNQKLKYQNALLEEGLTEVPFEFVWPIKENILNIKFEGREFVINNKIYFVVSKIGKMENSFTKSGIIIIHNRENDSRKKEDKTEAKKRTNNVIIPKLTEGKINSGGGVSGNNKVKVTHYDEESSDWLDNLPDSEKMQIEKQKWLTENNPVIKEFENSNIGDHNPGSENTGANIQTEELENNYYNAFPEVFNRIIKKFPKATFTELKFIDDQNLILDHFDVFRSSKANLSLLLESIEFCFKPRLHNLKAKSSRRRRKYSIVEVKIKNISYHILEIEPKRGCSSYCYIFTSKTTEDVQKFIRKYVTELGNEEKLQDEAIRINHPVRFLKKKKKQYYIIMSEKIISHLK